MTLQVDTREHKSEWERIRQQFDDLGIQYYRSKLYVGDYMNLDNPRIIVDRKKDLLELCGNVCQQHERFRKELIRAREAGIQLVILVEHGNGICTLEDVWFWENPRRTQVGWRYKDGKREKYFVSPKATNGQQLYKSLCTIHDHYGADFRFCDKNSTGATIVRILS